MLIAKTKNGKMVSLGYPFKKETLLALRKREEFFCPICEERVILKLGDQKIYHFSHQKGGNCRNFYENETEYHMDGKLKLYRWLRRQGIQAVLEYYDREIQQRPDILFYHHNNKYALEFQCSAISEQIFIQRTENYLSHGYIPLWIIGGSRPNRTNTHPSSLTNFQYLFLRRTSDGRLFIPSFSPDQNTLTILHSIFPYSTKNALLQKSTHSLGKLTLAALLNPILVSQLNLDRWRAASDTFKLHWSVYLGNQQRSFLQEVYRYHLNLFLFPPEIGLPVTHGLLFQTPPFKWQAYYYIDVLQHKVPGDLISFQLVEKSFMKRVKAKEIVLRNLPQITKLSPVTPFIEYTHLLAALGVLVKKTDNLFQVCSRLQIPQTNREKEELTLHFFSQNRQIFKNRNEKK